MYEGQFVTVHSHTAKYESGSIYVNLFGVCIWVVKVWKWYLGLFRIFRIVKSSFKQHLCTHYILRKHFMLMACNPETHSPSKFLFGWKKGTVHKPRGQIFGYICPLHMRSPSWTLPLNRVYLVDEWSFG